jgi:hypothetical protein
MGESAETVTKILEAVGAGDQHAASGSAVAACYKLALGSDKSEILDQ